MSSLERVRENADLVVLVGSAALLLALPGSGPLSPVRSMLGLTLALLAPGYGVAAVLFPTRRGIESIERAALSLGLSIVSIVVIALVLSFTARGITPSSLQASLAGFIAFFGLVAYWVRVRLQVDRNSPRLSTDSSLLLVVLATVLVVLAALVASGERPAAESTSFFVLGPNHLLRDYDYHLAPHEGFGLIVGIRNHELQPTAFQVTGPLLNAPVSVPVLPVGGEWQKRITLNAPSVPGRYKVSLALSRLGDAAPYRTLYVWVQVQ